MGINPQIVKKFQKNVRGEDYVVGDIHGHFDKLRTLLDAVRFNKLTDRLFCVGDLIDRGPKSEEVIHWLAEPWFHSVMGNHEVMLLDYLGRNGCDFPKDYKHDEWFGWLNKMSTRDIEKLFRTFNVLPAAMEVKTHGGKVGIVHADILSPSWAMFTSDLVLGGYQGETFDRVIWEYHRYKYSVETKVQEVDAVYVGHVIVKKPTVLGNVVYIDTGCYKTGKMTIVKLKTHETMTL